MHLRKYRWSRHYESAEEELAGFLRSRAIQADRWDAEAEHEFTIEPHQNDTQLFCVEGSLVITIDGRQYSLQPGDALDIPANTSCNAIAGLTGVVCYESQAVH